MGTIQFDIAATITAVSLVITSIGALLVALRGGKSSGESNSKAVAVTKISDTEHKVGVLIQQVDFLFEEIGRLRHEKSQLESRIDELNQDLLQERADHAETKRLLAEAVAELQDKTRRIKVLEAQIEGIQ